MIRLYKKDQPKNLTTWKWICKNSDQQEQQQKVLSNTKLNKLEKLYKFKHQFDTSQIYKDYLDATEKFGEFGWSSSADATGDDSRYRGLGITWNPNKIPFAPEHQSVLGSSDRNKFTYNTTDTPAEHPKDDHCDTLGFVQRTSVSKYKSIETLLSNVERTLVKSRISTIYGDSPSVGIDRPYHRDASSFIGTRVNIPIETHPPYVFDLETLSDPIHLEKGFAYSWDTATLHRVISLRPCSYPRTHIVINVCPWWDYNFEDQCWYTNEFYGQLHPTEMVLQGHIMKGLNLV